MTRRVKSFIMESKPHLHLQLRLRPPTETTVVQKHSDVLYQKAAYDPNSAAEMFFRLRDSVAWTEGIRSRYGHTRLACSLQPGEYPELHYIIMSVLAMLHTDHPDHYRGYDIHGIYLNYLRNGEEYVPQHQHKDTEQLVISLGSDRTLKVGSVSYKLSNGDAILFGSQMHGVAKETTDQTDMFGGARISIATFMCKI